MDPFEILVKLMDPFSGKFIYMHKIKYTDLDSISIYYDLYCRFVTKETNYAEIQVSKYKKIKKLYYGNICASLLIA